MKKLFEFKCRDCNTVTEKLIEYTKETTCSHCGGVADKIISQSSVKLEGITGSFPGAAMAWEKRHTNIAKKRD